MRLCPPHGVQYCNSPLLPSTVFIASEFLRNENHFSEVSGCWSFLLELFPSVCSFLRSTRVVVIETPIELSCYCFEPYGLDFPGPRHVVITRAALLRLITHTRYPGSEMRWPCCVSRRPISEKLDSFWRVMASSGFRKRHMRGTVSIVAVVAEGNYDCCSKMPVQVAR
jgi:hypothetical protein